MYKDLEYKFTHPAVCVSSAVVSLQCKCKHSTDPLSISICNLYGNMKGRGGFLFVCLVFILIVNGSDVIQDGIVHLKGAGTVLVVREEWMMAEIRGARDGGRI